MGKQPAGRHRADVVVNHRLQWFDVQYRPVGAGAAIIISSSSSSSGNEVL